MKNLGTAISAFLLSGGYLVAINKIQELQALVRTIPADYFLTPLVLFVVATGALWHINRKQKQQLSQIDQQPQNNEDDARFVTHFGVWWKIYPDTEYIEDFPYCPCCEPRKKLVQIEWHPDEVFKCPISGTEIKLYDRVPRKLHDVISTLYQSYFGGGRLEEELMKELRRLKELYPNQDDATLFRKIFDVEPFNQIPREELDVVFNSFPEPYPAISYFRRNYKVYRKYLRASAKTNK